MWSHLASPWSKGRNTRTNCRTLSVAVSWLSKDLDDRMEMKTERVETIGDTISLAVIQVWEPLDMSSWHQQNFKWPNSPAEKKNEVEERRVLAVDQTLTRKEPQRASAGSPPQPSPAAAETVEVVFHSCSVLTFFLNSNST